MAVKPLSAERLCVRTDAQRLGLETTASLPEPDGPVGQERALRALAFGAGMSQPGYNIFVSGPEGSGKHSTVQAQLEKLAATMPAPPDWIYVHNFDAAHRPQALRLPAGQGRVFKHAMDAFIEALPAAMTAFYGSAPYRERRDAIEAGFRKAVDEAFAKLNQVAAAQGLVLTGQDKGVGFVPARDGLPLPDEDYRALPKEERDRLAERARALSSDYNRMIEELNALRSRALDQLRALDHDLTESELRRLMRPLSDRFRDVPPAQAHVECVFADLVAHTAQLQALALGLGEEEGRDNKVPFHRYQVNVLVDHTGAKGAPVVSLPLPSLSQLVGKVEHVPVLISMITDFMYIRPGALHQANGGFLLIDALSLLQQDVSWEALKRVLRAGAIRIENLAEVLDRSQAVTLQPEPVPLEIKIVLMGEPWLFYRLRALDPDFAELFKVQADFSTTAPRNAANEAALLKVMGSVARRDGLKQLDRFGAARLLDESVRRAGDAEKLSVRTSRLADVLREADHFARLAGRSLIGAEDIDAAVLAQEDRAGQFKAIEQEVIERRIVFVDTDGAKIGTINGLSVYSLPGMSFGVPSRITARVRPGDGNVIDIERIVDFSGPTHSKGVEILTGYLNGQYSGNGKLSLSASLAFEQSYGPRDGDSASAAELIAILSAAAEVPIRQAIAITGSINQHGEIQPIGGVNQKIEGFFDICRLRGLKKGQGVIIPRTNVVNLMLRDPVVQAVREGKFTIWAVDTVDEAIEILTGMKAGAIHGNGTFPSGSFNGRVGRRLTWFARPRILRPIKLDGWWPF